MSSRRKVLEERFPNLHIANLRGQPYDPDVVAIDPIGVQVSQARLRLGYGVPPIVPYAQTSLPNFGLRDKLVTMFPRLKQWLQPTPAT